MRQVTGNMNILHRAPGPDRGNRKWCSRLLGYLAPHFQKLLIRWQILKIVHLQLSRTPKFTFLCSVTHFFVFHFFTFSFYNLIQIVELENISWAYNIEIWKLPMKLPHKLCTKRIWEFLWVFFCRWGKFYSLELCNNKEHISFENETTRAISKQNQVKYEYVWVIALQFFL